MVGKRRTSSKEKQAEILFMIIDYTKDKGYPPTLKEICNEFFISSKSLALYHLRWLEKDGYISRDRKVARGIRILYKSQPGRQVLVKPNTLQ